MYHVTDSDNVQDILKNGFIGGWGDVGYGVYFYSQLQNAYEYADDLGWDGGLNDPVIIWVKDSDIRPIDGSEIDPSWDETLYDDMFIRDMDSNTPNQRWKPQEIAVFNMNESKALSWSTNSQKGM